MSAYTIREMEPADDASALRAWNGVFARPGAGRVRSVEDWDWAYAKNPAGRRAFVAAHAGDVVALYAASPVRTLVEGEVRIFGQIVDSLVQVEHRAGLKRPGLFVGVGRKFFERFGAESKDVVFFGWPVDAAWRAGERFLNYAALRHEVVLAREAGPGTHELPRGVERIERFDSSVRTLHARCASAWGASTIRDERFLDWRVVDRPGFEYRRFGVRDVGGNLRGVAIQRVAAFMLPEASVLVDWLVPEDEIEVAELLLEAFLAQTRSDGVEALCGMVPPWSAWFSWFQTRGFLAHPTERTVAARSFSARYDVDWLRECWWYTLLDSDLV